MALVEDDPSSLQLARQPVGVDPEVVEVMNELGIDLAARKPKLLSTEV